MGSNYADMVRARVAAAIEASGLSEAELVQAARIPRTTLQRRLAGDDGFKVNELDRLATALGVPVVQLAAAEDAA